MRTIVMEIVFDPFENRSDRDVRNLLGAAFITSLHQADPKPVTEAVNALENEALSEESLQYIQDRCVRYDAVLQDMSLHGPPCDIYAVGAQLWDTRLFFECHEWLEQNYRTTQGVEKKVLQALIRTAGSFELLAYGKQKAAVSVAVKALAALEAYPLKIPAVFNIHPKKVLLERVVKGDFDLFL